jgi:alpha-galactosidase
MAKADEKPILTPEPSPEPRINGARVFGVRPGSPLLYKVAATGERPMRFEADRLPEDLVIDEKSGRITGRLDEPGEHVVMLRASNALGAAECPLRIVAGEKIALTPPMGWNYWNCWAAKAREKNVQDSAETMVSSGLIEHGWTYINIDDGWQGERGGPYHAIQPNEKFPDMQRLCDDIHGLGLKAGIYSTPWIGTYANYIGGSSDREDGRFTPSPPDDQRRQWRHGKYRFDQNDVRQWAEWGIDYLKYDWKPNDVPITKRVGELLRASGRDIVFSLSNDSLYFRARDFARLANCWRTTEDIIDVWDMNADPAESIGFGHGILNIWDRQGKWRPYNGPGHWCDPDMLELGKVRGPGTDGIRPTRLTPDEQYTHMSLWCLWSAPLLIGCPLEELDAFTLGLLTNDEVLEVNQDPLGRMAALVGSDREREVWAKILEDGSIAAGLFNKGEDADTVTLPWSYLDIEGRWRIRDLWRQRDLGEFVGEFGTEVPPHGVVLVRLAR